MKPFILLIFVWACSKAIEFQNPIDTPVSTGVSKFRATWALFFEDSPRSAPDHSLPIKELRVEDFKEDFKEDYQISWLGHATTLIKFKDKFFITDPVLGERVSPVSWIGPKRFHPLPIKELPELEAVIISHDHHDHLDEKSLLQLNARTKKFITPLKVGQYLESWGIPKEKIIELDWWQSTQLGEVVITCTPARHFSGRGLWGWNQTLWSSWVLKHPERRIYFAGDTGMFEGFKEIGERLGPMDLTLMPMGAYDELWSGIHLFPHEAIEAHAMVKGKKIMPVHWGSFDLSRHAWDEPMEEFKKHLGDTQALIGMPGEVFSF